MLIAQITDLHLVTESGLVYGVVDTAAYARAALTALSKLEPRPDMLLLTGDLADAGEAEAYTWLSGELDALGIPAYVIPGNHDLRAPMRQAFAHHGYLPLDGFLHYTIEAGPVRVIALDTVIEHQPGGLICEQRRTWLAERLAEDRRTPTLIMMHHQPFLTGTPFFDAIGLEGREAVAAVIAKAPNVERVICGHMHRGVIQRWAGTVASVCPGSAHQVGLELVDPTRLRIVAEPACYQLHHWTDEAGLVTFTRTVDDFPVLYERSKG
jgi:Icc protein